MRKWYLLIAIVLSVIAGLLVYTNTTNALKTETVYVWAKDMQAGDVVREEDLKPLDYPQTLVPKNAVSTPKALAGKVIQVNVVSGDVARENQIALSVPEKDMTGYLRELSVQDNEGKMNFYAFALPASLSTTVGETIKFGDRVDLFVLQNGNILYAVVNAQVLKVDPGKSVVLALPEATIPYMANFVSLKADFIVALKPKGLESSEEVINKFFNDQKNDTDTDPAQESKNKG